MTDRPETAWKRPESVLVLIHTADDLILLLERADVPGYWQSVTGALNWGESAREAALRELREETGLTDSARLHDLCESVTFPLQEPWRARYHPEVTANREHHFRYQVPAPVSVRLDAREHRAWRWLARAEAVKWVSSDTNRDLIERLADIAPAP